MQIDIVRFETKSDTQGVNHDHRTSLRVAMPSKAQKSSNTILSFREQEEKDERKAME